MYWFPITPGSTAEETLAHLAPLGVSLGGPKPPTTFFYFSAAADRVLQSIGSVVVCPDGSIRVVPFEGLTDAATATLVACAEDAFRHQPSTVTGWVRRRRKDGVYWMSSIVIPASASNPVALACAAGVVGVVEHEFRADRPRR